MLFVCLGNICRSPMAEGVLRARLEERGLAAQVEVDSAGTAAYHIDEPPDPRAQDTMRRHGIDIGDLRGRQVNVRDLQEFDYVLAMDRANLADLRTLAGGHADPVRLFLDFARDADRREVPDPYYGGSDGFERVYGLLQEAASGLVADIERRLGRS